MTSSSSSSEEDLSLFSSVAVTANDIAESAKKEAEAAVRKRSGNNTRSPGQVNPQPAASAAKADGQHNPAKDSPEQLDLTSLKIAAALDSMLARQLEDTAPPAGAAAATLATTDDNPAAILSTAADDDTTGVRLFKRVTPGAPCVLTGSEYGSNVAGADPSIAHHHPAMQQRVCLRDLIPRYALASKSSNSSKTQHQQVLTALAVDGHALLAAAAAAAGTAWQQQQQQDTGSSKQQRANAATAGTLAAWQSLKKRKVDGVVMEAKQLVPHHDRMAKLLGQTPKLS